MGIQQCAKQNLSLYRLCDKAQQAGRVENTRKSFVAYPIRSTYLDLGLVHILRL